MLLLAALLFAWSRQSPFPNDDKRFVHASFRVADSSLLATPMTDSGSPNGPRLPQYPSRIVRAISYGPSLDEVADLCMPDIAYLDAPAIVFIHGGAWTNGDQTTMDPVCQAAARGGLVGMTIQYRQMPENIWPTQLEDAQLAVRWLRAHAQDYKVDPARICSWGKSSGAHLAVFLGVMRTTQSGDRASLYADKSSAVSCVVDNFGPVDLTNAGKLQYGATRLAGNSPDALRDASPLFFVDSYTAPMLIVQGDADAAVDRATQSDALYQALKRQGVPAQMIIYHGDHGFVGVSENEQRYYEDLGFQFVISRLVTH